MPVTSVILIVLAALAALLTSLLVDSQKRTTNVVNYKISYYEIELKIQVIGMYRLQALYVNLIQNDGGEIGSRESA